MSSQVAEPRPISILLVEDNADDAALLERHLRRTGFAATVHRVETAAEMVAALQIQPLPEIILADYNLPNFSGPEALRLLKASGHDLPFIMMSGAMSEETAVASMRAGAQDYVIKQNLARLVPAVERELREAAARKLKLAAEQALHASEARFHRLVDAMPLGLLLSDAEGRITYANAAVEFILGYSSEEMLRGEVSLSQICAGFATDIGARNQLAESEPCERVCKRRDGSSIEVLLGTAYLNPEEVSERRQIAAFLVDLTKQKQGEEVLRRTEKLAVAGRLAASIAHEINNPLAAVTNCLFLVQQTAMTDEGRTYLDLAQKELDRVAQITVQTLRFHRQSSRPVESDVRELAETVLALFESRLRRQKITMVRQFRQMRPLLAYEGEIRQVIVNLLGNAIDASPNGGQIILRTSLVRDARSNSQGLAVTIADCGSGMSPDTLQRIFEPFFSTKGITGTGLGLWVSQEIVGRHGGTMQVRSRLRGEAGSGGTVFRVVLPLGGVPTPAPRSTPLDSM